MNKAQLLSEIRELRSLLYEKYNQSNQLSSYEMVIISQKLDLKLNQLQYSQVTCKQV